MVHDITKMVLGTVQLGMDYGIANQRGKPTKAEALKILENAWDKGVRYFDTAYAYGDAEEILGEFISNNSLDNDIRIISKLRPNCIDNDTSNINSLIENEINRSLKRLKMSKLDGYILHTPRYIYNAEIVDGLLNIKNKGLVENIGISIYEMEDGVYAAKCGVDYIQIPYSVFDQRADKSDLFQVANDNNVKIFARSVFVQGLLFLKEYQIPEHLSYAKKYINEFHELLTKCNLTIAEASLMFSYLNQSVNYIVVGIDNIDQLEEDINAFLNIKEIAYFMQCTKKIFNNIDKAIIFSSLWTDPNKKVN